MDDCGQPLLDAIKIDCNHHFNYFRALALENAKNLCPMVGCPKTTTKWIALPHKSLTVAQAMHPHED